MTYPGESWQSENTRRDLAAAHARRDAERLQAESDAQRQRAARARAAERRAAPALVAAEHVIRPEPPAQAAPPEQPRQRRLRYIDPASFYSVLEEDNHDHDNQ